MTFYEINVPRTDDMGDGEDCNEWHRSRRKAIARARAIARNDEGCQYAWYDISVDRVVLADLPRSKLAFAILCGIGWVEDREQIWAGTIRVPADE